MVRFSKLDYQKKKKNFKIHTQHKNIWRVWIWREILFIEKFLRVEGGFKMLVKDFKPRIIYI